jgi:hypothetical protein
MGGGDILARRELVEHFVAGRKRQVLGHRLNRL